MARLVAIASALFVLSTASLAYAGRKKGTGGRLSRVGGGLRAGGSGGSGGGGKIGGSGGGSGSSNWGRPQRVRTHVRTDDHGHRYRRWAPVLYTDAYAAPRGRLTLPSIGLAGDLYGGVQKLVESDTAYSLEGRLLVAKTVGVAGRFSQYRERTDEMATLKLDVWSIGATARLQMSPRVTLTPEIGFAGLEFRGDGLPSLVEVGVVGGFAARVRLVPHAALVGSAHVYMMTGAGSALELRGGVAAGPLQLSYRALTFYDAGPPLEGPEVGVGFRF